MAYNKTVWVSFRDKNSPNNKTVGLDLEIRIALTIRSLG
jgi:hypothetical protein